METLEQKLSRILREDLQAETHLETLPNGHISGDVVSALFEGKDYHDRRFLIREIWKKRRERGELTEEEYSRISTLLTYSPAEWNVALTDLPE